MKIFIIIFLVLSCSSCSSSETQCKIEKCDMPGRNDDSIMACRYIEAKCGKKRYWGFNSQIQTQCETCVWINGLLYHLSCEIIKDDCKPIKNKQYLKEF